MNASKITLRLSSEMPMPVSLHGEMNQNGAVLLLFRFDVQYHFATIGKLNGIAEQIDDHLAESRWVPNHHRRHVGVNIARKLQTLWRPP